MTNKPGEIEGEEREKKQKKEKIPAQESSFSQAIRSRREQRALSQAVEEKRFLAQFLPFY